MEFKDREFNSYVRQLGIIAPSQLPPITIIGAGAAGTCIAIVAAKMGVQSMSIYDGDKVSVHNIPNQFLPGNSIDAPKPEALSQILHEITPPDMQPTIITYNRHFDAMDKVLTPIVFMCVDSFKSRREVITMLREQPSVKIVIDSRMAGEYMELVSLKIKDDSEYSEYMKGLDGEVREAPCTSRSVIYTVMGMAARAMNYLKRFVKDEPIPLVYGENLANDMEGTYIEWRRGETPRERVKPGIIAPEVQVSR